MDQESRMVGLFLDPGTNLSGPPLVPLCLLGFGE
jgi:hypothetical protein